MNTFSVRIVARTLEDLRALDAFDLDLQRRGARRTESGQYMVSGIVDDAQIQQLRVAGYQVEVVADLTVAAEERRLEMSDTMRAVEACGLADLEARAVMGYMTAGEVETALARLSTTYPDLVTRIPLPYRTWEQRSCLAVRLCAGTSSPRIGVLFTGSMHAREWGGADACIAFLVNLINAYRAHAPLVLGGKTFTAAQVQAILRSLTILVFPDVNPDGKNYSQTTSMWWRKNRNPNAGVDPAHPGVDLNRNFDFLWSSGIGTSSVGCKRGLQRPSAFLRAGNAKRPLPA